MGVVRIVPANHVRRLPFDARSLPELKHRVIMGSFVPLTPGSPYSPALVGLVHALLSKDPRRRPTAAAILNSAEAAAWLHTLPADVRLPLPPPDTPLGEANVGQGGTHLNNTHQHELHAKPVLTFLPTLLLPRRPMSLIHL